MLSSIFEMATRISRSISFKHDRLSFLINTNVEKLCLHKYVVQNWRRISRAFSEICLYSFPTAMQNSSRVISRNFNRSVLSFRSSRKFSLIGNDNFCVEISALTEKGFRIQSYCYELIAKNNGHTFDVTKPNALLHQIRKKIAAVGNWALAVAGLDPNVIALVVAYRNELSVQPP